MSTHAEPLTETDFLHKFTISFPGYAGTEELEDFPVLVRLDPSKIEGFSYADVADGGIDLRFSDSEGNLLSHDIDTWNPEGESLLWVRVPRFTQGTEITAYYGGPATSPVTMTTWQDYAGVWHFSEASGTAYDSTANALDGTPTGAKASTMLGAAGVIGTARSNSGSTDGNNKSYLSIPNYNHLGLGNTFTLSGWFKSTGINGYPRYFSRKNSYADNDGWEIEAINNSNTGITARGVKNDKTVQPTIPNVTQDWVFLSFVYDGGTLSVYANGALARSGAIDPATDNGRRMSIGCDSDGSETTFGGWFDEARLRDGCLSANWIATEYDNVKNPGFAAFGNVMPIAADLPSLGSSAILDVDFHSVGLSYNVFRLGSTMPDLWIAYGTDPEALSSTQLVAAAHTDLGVGSHVLPGLACNTTYYMRHIARNQSGEVAANVVSFTTPGVPALGEASASAVDTSVTVTGSLTDIGVAATTVELYFGADPENLALVQTWPTLAAPQDLSYTLTGLPFATYTAKFRAFNTCEGAVHEVWSDAAVDTVFGTVTWTGAAGDSDWNNPYNWNTHTVPGFKDTAILTSAGLANRQTLHFSQNQAVAALIIDTPYELTLGDAADVEAGYTFTIGDLTRVNTEGNEGRILFAANLLLTSARSDLVATWDLQGNGEIRLNGNLLGALDGVGLTKIGGATLATYQQVYYTGKTIVLEGSFKNNKNDAGYNLGGDVIIGSPDGTAYASYEAGNGGKPKNVTVYQNGYYYQGDWPGSGGHTIYGGRVSLSWSDINGDIRMTGGQMTGGPLQFHANGHYSYAAPTTAKITSTYWMDYYVQRTFVFSAEDGEAPVDFWFTGPFRDFNANSSAVKRGDGVLRFSGNDSTFTQKTFTIEAGTLLIDNTAGAGLGQAPVRVNGGATLGGTGFLGGGTGYTVANVSAIGAAENLATVAPGTIDDETGAHVCGTLTVGSTNQVNSATFGSHSQLRVTIGPEETADCLAVYGSVDLTTADDTLVVELDPEACPGTYTLLSATEGITGAFDHIVAEKPNRIAQTATTITYTVPDPPTRIFFR